HIDREKHGAIMLAESPERDRDIAGVQTLIRNCAAAGIPSIKYNMSLLGVLRTGHTPGRGDASYSAWRLADSHPDPPLTRAGRVNADMFWERITYFLERVIPVAAENKIRMACHPHDPGVPPEGYQGVTRVLGTVDGLKKFISIKESPYHGLNFCQGTVSEMLADPGKEIYDVIRYFGSRQKIFNVHFRNIRGHRDEFVETYPDDGDVDFVKAIQTYKEVGYPYLLMPDHVPLAPGDPGGLQSFAFCYGYIRALIQAADRLGEGGAFSWFVLARPAVAARSGAESPALENGFRRRRALGTGRNPLPRLATPHRWVARRPSTSHNNYIVQQSCCIL